MTLRAVRCPHCHSEQMERIASCSKPSDLLKEWDRGDGSCWMPGSWMCCGCSTACVSPRLGKFVELLPAAYGLHAGINISRICSHLWPRASSDAANHNSPSSASRAIARAFCPTVIAPCANANLSEADGDVDAR